MNELAEHWLSLGTGVFLLAMILYGHGRGLLRMTVTVVSLFSSLFVVHLGRPCIMGLLRTYTPIYQMFGKGIVRLIEKKAMEGNMQLPEQQRVFIQQLKLPFQLKEALLENNNREIYHLLGVDAFFDYLGNSLASMIINLAGSLLLFVVSYMLIKTLSVWLGIMEHLPVVSGLNQIAGAVLGGVQGLLVLWIAGIVVRACSESAWAQAALLQINQSAWLSTIYENNIFGWILADLLGSIG